MNISPFPRPLFNIYTVQCVILIEGWLGVDQQMITISLSESISKTVIQYIYTVQCVILMGVWVLISQ